MAKPNYYVADPRPTAKAAPYTFFLPSPSEVAAVGKGDLVKLLFEYTHEVEKWGGERMWVHVEKCDGDGLYGVLGNIPDEPTAPLKEGDPVTFRRHDILDIVWETPGAAPSGQERREFWDRCMVDQCVLDEEEPVEYLYREEPDLADDDDEYRDSGWRIRGRRGNATDSEMDERKVAYVALGAVLNRDDSWFEWIDAPIGTALMRDFKKEVYVREGA